VRQPSRGFLFALLAALLVLAGLLGLWLRLRAPNRWAGPPPPDVWLLEGKEAAGDPRSSPGGPPVAGWECAGYGDVPIGGRVKTPFVVLVSSDEATPSEFRQFVDRLTGDPMRSWRERNVWHLYRTDRSADSPSGRWWLYSSHWWKGASHAEEAEK
jgi:hypothetical protein